MPTSASDPALPSLTSTAPPSPLAIGASSSRPPHTAARPSAHRRAPSAPPSAPPSAAPSTALLRPLLLPCLPSVVINGAVFPPQPSRLLFPPHCPHPGHPPDRAPPPGATSLRASSPVSPAGLSRHGPSPSFGGAAPTPTCGPHSICPSPPSPPCARARRLMGCDTSGTSSPGLARTG